MRTILGIGFSMSNGTLLVQVQHSLVMILYRTRGCSYTLLYLQPYYGTKTVQFTEIAIDCDNKYGKFSYTML
jgi:hypothetical protein